jgi:hypothetical protein
MMSCGKRFQTFDRFREEAEFQYIGLGWKSEIMFNLQAYKELIRPVLEYTSTASDPHQSYLQEKLEKVQKRPFSGGS